MSAICTACHKNCGTEISSGRPQTSGFQRTSEKCKLFANELFIYIVAGLSAGSAASSVLLSYSLMSCTMGCLVMSIDTFDSTVQTARFLPIYGAAIGLCVGSIAGMRSVSRVASQV